MPAFRDPPNASEILPDHAGDRHRFRFKVRSDSNPAKTYTISYDGAEGAGYWVCSCPAGIYRGGCKHLDAAGLRGRMYGRSPLPELATARPERPAAAVMRRRQAAPRRRLRVAPVPVPGLALSRKMLAEDRAARKRMREAFCAAADDEVLTMLA